MISVFTLISQSLRTGEPIHQTLPHPLVERLFYHHRVHVPGLPSEKMKNPLDVDELQSLDFIYFATAVVSVHQLLQARSYFIHLLVHLVIFFLARGSGLR